MARIVGMLLIVAGAVGLIWGGYTYVSDRHEIAMGPMQMQVEQRKTVPIPPLVGAVLLVAGTALVVVGGRRRAD